MCCDDRLNPPHEAAARSGGSNVRTWPVALAVLPAMDNCPGIVRRPPYRLLLHKGSTGSDGYPCASAIVGDAARS